MACAAELSFVVASLNERVANLVRQKIVQGKFMPGQTLSEVALRDSLAISRNTLREVFRTLTTACSSTRQTTASGYAQHGVHR